MSEVGVGVVSLPAILYGSCYSSMLFYGLELVVIEIVVIKSPEADVGVTQILVWIWNKFF